MTKPLGNLLRAILLALTLVFVVACGNDDRHMTYVAEDDVQVNAAMDEARKTLPYFWATKKVAAANTSDFDLKVGLPTPDGSKEHIWVNNVERRGTEISGVLANNPADLGDLKFGQTVTFTKEQISDWAFMRDGKLYGHYTTRVMFSMMSKEEATYVKSLLGENR